MNRKIKLLLLSLLLISAQIIGYVAFAATDTLNKDEKRVLSSPIWMPDDVLIDNENVPHAKNDEMLGESEMGFTEPLNYNQQKFTNLVDGYTIIIPYSMSVDLSNASTGAILKDNYRTLKIFKETFSTASERLSYLSYSNKFIENTIDHKLEKEENYKYGEYEYHVLQWSRRSLSEVSGDKNYYACVDVCIGARVYTFFFSASKPFTQCGGYIEIVNSLKTFDPSVPTENVYTREYKANDLSRLNASAKATYDNLFSEKSDLKMGIFSPDKFGGFEKLEEFEEFLDYKFCAFLVYTEIPEKGNDNRYAYDRRITEYLGKIERYFTYAQQTGKAIELTLQSPLVKGEGSSNMMYDILDGKYDAFINAYAELIAKYPNVTVLFRPFNEMNGDWCNYSSYHTSRDPQIFVEVYRYLHKSFDKVGCNNTLWIWNPNERSFPNFKWNNQSLYYPGDNYVDIYGITGYNTGTYYEGESWRSFDEIYAPVYEKATKHNEKPIMITEFSCSAIGGDKIVWIEDMFKSLPKYDKIKVAIWWHATDYDGENLSRPYFMDTPHGTMDVFKEYLN